MTYASTLHNSRRPDSTSAVMRANQSLRFATSISVTTVKFEPEIRTTSFPVSPVKMVDEQIRQFYDYVADNGRVASGLGRVGWRWFALNTRNIIQGVIRLVGGASRFMTFRKARHTSGSNRVARCT